MSIQISVPTADGTKVAVVPLPTGGISSLRKTVQSHLLDRNQKDFMLTDTLKDITNDEDVAALRDGAALVVMTGKDGSLAAPARERISFQPHPKTLTMAGDYEYFAAQGRHPFVYALAEFVDNSLRATRANAPNPRNISITLVTTGSSAAKKGLVCIQDNGCGMSKQDLNEWAVMNYSMEERGHAPQEPQAEGRGRAAAAGSAPGRFLTGDLSYFGVGSKNAAFFMGSSVKVVTRKTGERFVHELSLEAATLEARYRNKEVVYEEEMVHRNPGDDSTLSRIEDPFTAARGWIKDEEAAVVCGAEGAFTRVIVGDLKPDILKQLSDDHGGSKICRELAHLYHYYLHGETGNRVPAGAAADGQQQRTLPNGEPLPRIVLRHALDTRVLWERSLDEVDDDMETKILRTHKAEMTFTLQVPERGTVSGVLYYFPNEDGRETVPVDADLSADFAASVAAAGGGATQMPQATQFGATQTNMGGGGGSSPDERDDPESMGPGAWRAPIFKAFWQGRLIPGARIDTLPFLESVQSKRSAASKDSLPDEVFNRVRGALFFGPAFLVTRNKLLFRDNLPERLATGVPGDRSLEKRFKEWLAQCHATLDRSTRFEGIADSKTQAALRSRLGEHITAFTRVSTSLGAVSAGDVVRLAGKPATVGRVKNFTVPQAVREEGCYPRGRVHVEPLPTEVYGDQADKEFSLRRLEAVLDEREAEAHRKKEVGKLPAMLWLEPMRYGTGETMELAACDAVPQTTMTVTSIGNSKLTRSFYNGERQVLVVTQRLWLLPHEGAPLPDDAAAAEPEAEPEAERPAKRQRKFRKTKKGEAPAEEAEAGDGDGTSAAADTAAAAAAPAAELVYSVENKAPSKDAVFVFARIANELKRMGHYALEYVMTPAVTGQPPLRKVVPLRVSAGAPTGLKVSGEGVAAAATREICLGEAIPTFKVSLSDEFGNEVPLPSADDARIHVQVAMVGDDGETMQKCKGTAMAMEHESAEGSVQIHTLQVTGSKKAAAAGAGIPMFQQRALGTNPSAGTGAQRKVASQTAVTSVAAFLCFSMLGNDGAVQQQEPVPVRLLPGAPHSLCMVPGGYWGGSLSSAAVQAGDELPDFSIQALDAWGNPTAPSNKLRFSMTLSSDGLVSPAREFPFDSSGIATVSGARAALCGCENSTVVLGLKIMPGSDAMQAAVDMAQPTQELSLPLHILPSAYPAYAKIVKETAKAVLKDGIVLEPAQYEDLPMVRTEGEDGPVLTALIEGCQAGIAVAGLRLVLLDETGAVATSAISGRCTVSWYKGQNKATWTGKPLRLPSFTRVPESVTEHGNGWVRFQGNATNPVTIECAVDVRPVPGPPVNWAVSLVDDGNGQGSSEEGVVYCGRTFALEIEAFDRFNNRCQGGQDALPEPQVALEAEGPLEYNPDEWERGWKARGEREDKVYCVRMAVSGHPGAVKIMVRDAGRDTGESLLGEDALTVELRPGPPVALAFEGPANRECGTHASFKTLEVSLKDVAGYATAAAEGFEVTLAGSALAVDGSGRAAKVVADGANKVKFTKRKGSMMFKNVVVTAEAPGTYALRVQSASRKVALQEGVLNLVMTPLTLVTGLQIALPPECAKGCLAGTAVHMLVATETDDGQPLPAEAAKDGLTLHLTPPGGSHNDTQTISWPPAVAAEEEQEEGGEQKQEMMEGGAYVFMLPELNQAGTWTAAAEFLEPRPQVKSALGPGNPWMQVRSAAVQFAVLPGAPVTAAVEAHQLPDRLAVTNAPSAKSRLLLRNAAAQVQDEHGNVAAAEGLQVRFHLRLAGTDPPPEGSALPSLAVEEGANAKPLDDRGRAYFGKLSIEEGSGRAPVGALECELVCEALGLYPSTALQLDLDEEGWAVTWRCPVLFSDNAAQFEALERLNEQRGALAERRAELQSRMQEAHKAVAEAEKQKKRAMVAASAMAKRTEGPLPATIAEARKALKKAEKGEGSDDVAARPVRFGPGKSPMTAAVDMVLRSGDEGLVGVMAQLVTVDDDRLAQVASYAFRGCMGLVVLKDADCRPRIETMLRTKKYPVPDILPLTQVNVYKQKGRVTDPIAFDKASELAHALTRAASNGTDRPLPLALPHQRYDGKKLPCHANEWPKGCLGYLVNLLRPVHSGHRATLIYGMMSGTVVFETLEDACNYRNYVINDLKMPCGVDLISLDGRKVTSRGIILGDHYNPPPIEKADFMVGSRAGEGGGPEQVEALKSWIEVLNEKEAADAAVAAAQEAAGSEEAHCQSEIESVDAELEQVDDQMAHLQSTPSSDGDGGRRQQQKRGGGHDEEEGRSKRRRKG